MKVNLYDFQQKAVNELHKLTAVAPLMYAGLNTPQIVSFTAPTGAGKTVIMTGLFENIFFGSSGIPEKKNAVIVWLSDSPQLNKQSLDKIAQQSNKISISQCRLVDDFSFDQEIFDDGTIYFLNTQKLGKKGNLTRYGDSRTYTIWDTFRNTVARKADRLVFVIDEAHRGADDTQAVTTIMKKFILGSPTDELPPMPFIIGMTATPGRFDAMISNAAATRHCVKVDPAEVIASGLLKERIIVSYPDSDKNQDMAILQAAAGEWLDKCQHWRHYCTTQHYAQVNPVFIVQVENASPQNRITETNLDDCLEQIESVYGQRFQEGEAVHCFDKHETLKLQNGYNLQYEEPSRINENRSIKVVFFKTSLSTGWDCPRAEAMMSFRSAEDVTNIAQLLGRMVRTPRQSRVSVDESLNEVRLFLPRFNRDSVKLVLDGLKCADGGELPCETTAEEYTHRQTVPASIIPQAYIEKIKDIQASLAAEDRQEFNAEQKPQIVSSSQNERAETVHCSHNGNRKDSSSYPIIEQKTITVDTAGNDSDIDDFELMGDLIPEVTNRKKVLDFINNMHLHTYTIRPVRSVTPLKSWFRLANLLTQTGLAPTAVEEAKKTVADMIENYVKNLHKNVRYDSLVQDVKEFKLASQIFPVYQEAKIDTKLWETVLSSAELDIERQFEACERNLGNEGIGICYVSLHFDEDDPYSRKIEFIGFTTDKDWQEELNKKADDEFHELIDRYSRETVKLSDEQRSKFNRIISEGSLTSRHNFMLPLEISINDDKDAQPCSDHFFLADDGFARIALTSQYEIDILNEERHKKDFLFWIRNESKKAWALCLPRQDGGKEAGFYPDFLIVRQKSIDEFELDVLEPHCADLADNVSKAKALADFFEKEKCPGLGRVQLIRKGENKEGQKGYLRLDMSKSKIREEVKSARAKEDLDYIFKKYGEIDILHLT